MMKRLGLVSAASVCLMAASVLFASSGSASAEEVAPVQKAVHQTIDGDSGSQILLAQWGYRGGWGGGYGRGYYGGGWGGYYRGGYGGWGSYGYARPYYGGYGGYYGGYYPSYYGGYGYGGYGYGGCGCY